MTNPSLPHILDSTGCCTRCGMDSMSGGSGGDCPKRSIFDRFDELTHEQLEIESALHAKKLQVTEELKRVIAEHGVGPHDHNGTPVRIFKHGATHFIKAERKKR